MDYIAVAKCRVIDERKIQKTGFSRYCIHELVSQRPIGDLSSGNSTVAALRDALIGTECSLDRDGT